MAHISKMAIIAGSLIAGGLTPCTSALVAQVDMGCSPTVANPCSGGGGGVQTYTPPARDYAAERRQQEEAARQQRLWAAHAANEQGLQFYNSHDWAKAIAAFQNALNNNPDDGNIRQNLANARQKLADAEAQQRLQEQNKASADRMRQSIQSLAQSLDAAPAVGGLDFDGNTKPAKHSGNSGALDFASTLPAARPQASGCGDTGSTMVVNACNVPSGLPKSVDAAIPHTPAGDRMRKGFQAIQTGNWAAALAWFREAVKKEPGNPTLKRLVDLAYFTLNYRPMAIASAGDATPTSVQPDRSPRQKSNAAAADLAAVEDGDAAGRVGSLEGVTASSIAARARADAAFKQYEEKYGDHANDVDRMKAVQAAQRGEGYSDEELKSQLYKALLEYRKAHKGQVPGDGVNGTPAVKDISLGGKG